MSLVSSLRTILERGLDDAASGFMTALDRLRRPPTLRLVEEADGAFALFDAAARPISRAAFRDGEWRDGDGGALAPRLAGASLELWLAGSRFVFRQIELPRRAGDFLEGVVRAQIDSLTPWKPQDALFGWSAPRPQGAERIGVVVAVTPRVALVPLVAALEAAGVASLHASAPPDAADAGGARINVLARRPGDAVRRRRWRAALAAGLALAVAAALLGEFAALFLGGDIADRAATLQGQIVARRAALQSGRGSEADRALAALIARRRATPASVMVIEALSRALPDDAYLTQLHIEGDKVQFGGLAADAPALIGRIEQSPAFRHAAFDAPTTRTASEAGERFHIEAQASAIFTASP